MTGHRTGDVSLAQSLTSFPSISDLGQTYRSHDPNSMSQDEDQDDGEARDHAHDLSAPASPSQALSRSLSVSSTSSAQHVDASPTKHNRHASAVTFGGTTTLSAGEYSDNESLRPPIFRRRTTSTALLGGNEPVVLDYGTMSNGARSKSAQGSPSLSGFASLRSPRAQKIRRTLEATAGYVGVRRAQSYDEGLGVDTAEISVASNGNRHWTASYASVDWIHDSVKESARSDKLRALAKLSWRWRLVLLWDRFQGWLVVTIVGILTAFVAFAIVRVEGLLFDLKDGFCARPDVSAAWQLNKEFCCRSSGGNASHTPALFVPSLTADILLKNPCPSWRTWDSVIGPYLEFKEPSSWASWVPLERYMVEYFVYCLVAVTLATISSCLTVKLTRSTLFETRRDVVVDEKPRKVMFFAAGSGIGEIKAMLSGFVIHGYLGTRVLFTKSIGLALSVAANLQCGKEGPLVHIACCIGNMTSRLLKKYDTNEGKRREILSAACAAGVAVAFGAPIGGTLFSLEEVSYYFPPKVMWRSFWCAGVAATTLKALDPFGTGKIVLFEITYDTDWRYPELFVFAFIGCAMGLYGALFARLNILWSKHVRGGMWMKTNPISEVAMITLVTAVLSFVNPYTHMGGPELVLVLLSECQPDNSSHLCVKHPKEIGGVITSLAIAMVLRGMLACVTFGVRIPAGVFVPSMAFGACFGRIVGLVLQDLQSAKNGVFFASISGFHGSKVNPGVFAMVGAAAALAGVTRTTISLAVIVMELTGSLTYAVPILIAVLAAKTVADALEPKGIYDLVIELNQIPYLDAKETHRWGLLQVSDVNNPQAAVIRCDKVNSVRDLTQLAVKFNTEVGPDGGFPVLEKVVGGLRLRGVLALNDLEHLLVDLQSQPDATCNLKPAFRTRPPSSLYPSAFPFSESLLGLTRSRDPLDLTPYIDQTPLTIQLNSPLEVVQQLFVKLGVRSLVSVNEQGFYAGLISKSHWLTFLEELDGGQ